MSDLKQQVQDFNMLELPGQPRIVHMGTSYLVNDLWRRIKELEAQIATVKELPRLAVTDFRLKTNTAYFSSEQGGPIFMVADVLAALEKGRG